MKDETSTNVWKESFPFEIRFLTRNNDLRKVAGNWTRPETGPHTVLCFQMLNFARVGLNCYSDITVCGPVSGHKRPKHVFRTSEGLQSAEITANSSFSIQETGVKLTAA